MEKVLVLGLGGTGGRIVGYTARELEKDPGGFPKDRVICMAMDIDRHDLSGLWEDNKNVCCIDIGSEGRFKDSLDRLAGSDVSWIPDSAPWEMAMRMSECAGRRWKGRLAFLDAWTDGRLQACEKQLTKLLSNECHQVKVLIVSSLAGSFGTGVFLQTALWIRQFFERNSRIQVTIDGYLLMPEVYGRFLHHEPQHYTALYAGAYAAVSEWNAIEKIKVGTWLPPKPIKLDGLFNSEEDQSGMPVFHNTYLIGTTEEGGMQRGICEYEEMTGRCLAVRALGLTALEASLDGMLLSKQKEQVVASCGIAKAVYPTRNVLRYCALRHTKDYLEECGRLHWTVKEDAAQMDEKDPRKAFVESFDRLLDLETNADPLIWLTSHVREEIKWCNEQGEICTCYGDKVETFLAAAEKQIEDLQGAYEVALSDLEQLSYPGSEDPEDWCCFVKTMDTRCVSVYEKMEATVEHTVRALLNRVVPESAQNVCPGDPLALDRLFEKTDTDGAVTSVHPLAAKYLIYKLAAALEEYPSPEALSARRRHIHDFGTHISFDNPFTGSKEADAIAYLRSRSLLQSRKKYFDRFRQVYTQAHLERVHTYREFLCDYAKQMFARKVFRALQGIAESIDSFFVWIEETKYAVTQMIGENIQNTQNAANTLYVCASASEKEDIYQVSRLQSRRDAWEISDVLLRGFHAQSETMRYGLNGMDVHFWRRIMPERIVNRLEEWLLHEDKGNIQMDIGTAVCRSSDLQRNGGQETEIARIQRHNEALRDLGEHLRSISAPMLETKETGCPVMLSVLHPDAVQQNPALMAIHTNRWMLEQRKSFGRDEWICYCDVYDVPIGAVAQFDTEEENGFYQAYCNVRENMADTHSTIETPHLDKNWHALLPPIVPHRKQ